MFALSDRPGRDGCPRRGPAWEIMGAHSGTFRPAGMTDALKLNRLRLTGFKSFVEPTELVIESGLTGVVGPNGCGKSNLLEALRWVMGESSYKSMRASGMDDVIFSGTSGRPARNMAEVVLAIDNAGRTAPAAYNDEDVIEVSRRIEREMGSAYRINGSDARARDVQTFFADASTGAHSPALVQQGQIGRIISAKPTQRRQILEEAAGISGLHARRHEAELRLRQAETNLERLDDVMGQIETQLQSLKRQARQATRFRNVSRDIRRAEAMALYLRHKVAADVEQTHVIGLQEADRAVAAATEETARTSRVQFEAGEKLPELRETEARAAAAFHRLTVERDTIANEARQAEQALERLSNLLRQIEADLARERDGIKDTSESLEALTAEEAELRQADEGSDEARERAQAEVTRLTEALAEKEAGVEELSRELADLSARRQALMRRVNENKARYEKLVTTRTRLANEREEIARSDDVQAAMAGRRAAVDRAREAVRAAEAAAQDAERARTDAATAEEQARPPLSAAQQKQSKMEAEASALADLLRVADGDLWPPLIDSVSVRPGFEAALGAALGEDIEQPADEASPVHWHTLPAIDQPRPLPEGAEPLSTYVDGPAALQRRLSHVGLVDKAIGRSLQAQLQPGQRLVSKEGDMWRWDGFTAAAEAPTAAAQRLAQRNRLAELDAELETARAETKRLQDAHEAARQAVKDAQSRENAVRTEWKSAQGSLTAAQDALAAAEKAASAQITRLAAVDEGLARTAEDIEEARQALDAVNKEAEDLPEEGAKREAFEAMRAEVQQLRQDASHARAAFDGLAREVQQRKQRLGAIAQERTRWQGRLETANRQIETLEERLASTRAEREALEGVPAQVEEKAKALMDKLSEAETTRKDAADALATAENELRAADTANKDANDALAKARETRARIDAMLEGARNQVAEAARQIQEAFECAPAQVLAAGEISADEELPPLEDVERKLERYKRERENMGAVNLRAEEESREAEEQLESMQNERGDLEQAIAKLRQGIGSLNKEGRQRLLDAFGTVNDNFSRLFTRLFGGGTAHLELVESDDPLEAGLEIFARPPGKRLTTLSLLSGGEQALTAMSLVFAVFLTNPSPICVLDEVDAPLDDANVERFCKLLEDMRTETETRFLVITHHPLTMANMDRLFGVTMAEPGVSQLVSVDLAGAEAIREAG